MRKKGSILDPSLLRLYLTQPNIVSATSVSTTVKGTMDYGQGSLQAYLATDKAESGLVIFNQQYS